MPGSQPLRIERDRYNRDVTTSLDDSPDCGDSSPDRPAAVQADQRAEAAGDRATVVTIDGPAGTGKSTVARRVAERLGYAFLDTGAMYRAVALLCLDRGVDPSDPTAAGGLVDSVGMVDGHLCVDGKRAGDQLRTLEVTQAASLVAQHSTVRQRLVDLQREFGRRQPIVTEGRDQGTVVFPSAGHKFFLSASVEERARRRQRELESIGREVDLAELTEQIRERDDRDQSRAVAPLRPADDATQVDTTSLTMDEVVDHLVRLCRGEPASR